MSAKCVVKEEFRFSNGRRRIEFAEPRDWVLLQRCPTNLGALCPLLSPSRSASAFPAAHFPTTEIPEPKPIQHKQSLRAHHPEPYFAPSFSCSNECGHWRWVACGREEFD